MAQYNKIIQEYENLKSTLNELLLKSQHQVLAPICYSMSDNRAPIAYCPATIDHTNQVTVLLGCDYFVECSVHQAMGIIQRRISFCEEKKKQYAQQLENMENWLKFEQQLASEQQGFVEIQEEYDEEAEQKWREEHKKKVKKHKEKEKIERLTALTKNIKIEKDIIK